MEDKKQIIINNVKDLVADFVYYDRKEDEDLSGRELEDAVKNGDISIKEIVSIFEKELTSSLSIDGDAVVS